LNDSARHIIAIRLMLVTSEQTWTDEETLRIQANRVNTYVDNQAVLEGLPGFRIRVSGTATGTASMNGTAKATRQAQGYC
jgi:hypothetical protein